jgi:hypothetical protein
VSNAIQFGINGEVHSLDGQVLNKHINTANATERAASRGIQVTDTTAQRVTIGGARELLDDGQSHAVILDPFAGTKAVVNGVETSKAAAAYLAKARPDLVNSEAPRAQGLDVASQPTAAEVEATKAALKAEADAAKAHHAELNRIDNPLGAQVMDAVRKVDQGLLTRTLIAVQRGEDVSKHLKTAADQMGISPDLALGYLTIASTELDKQVQRFAQSQGVSDYPAFQVFAAKQPDGRSISAMATHAKVRDAAGVWGDMVKAYKLHGGR